MTQDPRPVTTGPMPTTADVVIIGGGVVGAFTALELTRRGLRPLLVEKGSIGGEQSSRNWGYIRQQGRDDPEIPLMVEAHNTWASFESDHGVDIGWAERGNLRLLARDADLDWYRNWAVKGNAHGVPARMLDASEVTGLLPRSTGQWAGAMFTPNDGQADPGRATRAVAAVAASAGTTIRTETTAEAIEVADGKVVGVRTSRGTVATPRVVVAGGIWSRRLLRPLGLNLPMQWVRLTVSETGPVPGFPDIPAVWSHDVAFRKTDRGTVLFAASQRADVDVMLSAANNIGAFSPTLAKNLRTFQVRVARAAWFDARSRFDRRHRYSGWEPRPNAHSVEIGRTALARIYPELAEVPVARSWGGYIDGTPDNLPVLSTVDDLEGLVIGAGFSGHGFGLSPASGGVLADLAIEGTSPRHDVSAFRFARFASGEFRRATTVAH